MALLLLLLRGGGGGRGGPEAVELEAERVGLLGLLRDEELRANQLVAEGVSFAGQQRKGLLPRLLRVPCLCAWKERR